MTIDDPSVGSQLLAKDPPVFFDAKIPFKSLITCPEADVLYYPNNNRIYSINTGSKTRRVVACLPFNPRCIGARWGWLVAGGPDRGQFVSIRTADTEHSLNSPNRSDSNQQPFISAQELGGQIVNSVTLHRSPNSIDDNDVIAIMTNNDRSVRIYHLAQDRILQELMLDVSANHASISPDGRHLVIVGDSPNVWFYHPESLGSRRYQDSDSTRLYSRWKQTRPPISVGTDVDALMSTSFSSSSNFCAVASQTGQITIFDTAKLFCRDGLCNPIRQVIPSSRPGTDAGAIRSVQFSPSPWDLLVWSEHSGRVCIADARTDFARRQVIRVFEEKDDITEAPLEELPVTPAAWVSVTSNIGDVQANRRASTTGDQGAMARLSDPLATLTGADTVMRPPAVAGGIQPSTGSRIPPLIPSTPPHNPVQATSSPPQVPPAGPSVQQPTPSGMPDPPRTGALQNFASIALLQEQIHREQMGDHGSPDLSSYNQNMRVNMETLLSRPMGTMGRRTVHPGWANSEDNTMDDGRTTRRTGDRHDSRHGLRPVVSSAPNRRAIVNQTPPVRRPIEQIDHVLAEQRRRARTRNARASTSGWMPGRDNNLPIEGIDITGCTLDPTGRKLYIATNEGVVEYSVDLQQRKMHPAIQMR